MHTASKCSKARLWRTGPRGGARQSKGNVENAQGTRDDEAAERAPSMREVSKEKTSLHAIWSIIYKIPARDTDRRCKIGWGGCTLVSSPEIPEIAHHFPFENVISRSVVGP